MLDIESTFHQVCYLKLSFKLVNTSYSYARKAKWLFFSETHLSVGYVINTLVLNSRKVSFIFSVSHVNINN